MSTVESWSGGPSKADFLWERLTEIVERLKAAWVGAQAL